MDSERNKLVRIKISDIEYTKSKLKDNDYQLFEKLRMSIQSQGQLKSITVCELENCKYECIEGSKILKSMIELNYDEVIAINIGKVTQIEKDIIRLQLFKDFFMVDYSAVGLMLKEIVNEVQIMKLCNTIPFDKRQVENLINLTNFDWEAFNMNKQLEGQMSLFGMLQEKEEEVMEYISNEIDVTNQIELIDEQPIIEKEPVIEKPITSLIEKPISNEIEKDMSILNETITHISSIPKIEQPTIVRNDFIKDGEVLHEYAHIVYLENGEYKMMPERQYFDIGKKYEQLHRNTFSNCRMYINELKQKSI
jgi:hypothetical protein